MPFFRKPKRIRTAFTPHQLIELENAFVTNHYVVGKERKDLAKRLELNETQVCKISQSFYNFLCESFFKKLFFLFLHC